MRFDRHDLIYRLKQSCFFSIFFVRRRRRRRHRHRCRTPVGCPTGRPSDARRTFVGRPTDVETGPETTVSGPV